MTVALDLKKISQYRTPLMGISALMVIMCHFVLYSDNLSNVVRRLLELGNVGVDIFLLLSGIGCYYSLKNGGANKMV